MNRSTCADDNIIDMFNDSADILAWIDQQADRLLQQVADWSAINSGTHHLAGLAKQLSAIEKACEPLGGECKRIDLEQQQLIAADGRLIEQPLGQAMILTKRPEAKRQVLLGIHYDTVYGPDHPFQKVTRLNPHRLGGPGVADAKGGLAVMLVALEAFELSKAAEQIGWRLIFNPDEEIGSPGSRVLLTEAARSADVGLWYEPALPDGGLIGARKGSGNFSLAIHGRSAHAGRDFAMGRNALHAGADAIVALNNLNGQRDGLTINVARLDGGGPVNIVPDLAIVRFNVRVPTRDDMQFAQQEIHQIAEQINARDGLTAKLHGDFSAPPKPMTESLSQFLQCTAKTGETLGVNLPWSASGGVCDGNRLAAAGLPTIDTLGVVGAHLHSDQEYIEIDSLTQRAKLSALLLWNLATGALNWPIKPQTCPTV